MKTSSPNDSRFWKLKFAYLIQWETSCNDKYYSLIDVYWLLIGVMKKKEVNMWSDEIFKTINLGLYLILFKVL